MIINNRIYADYNATTPVDPRVLEAMEPYQSSYFGNPHSNSHSFGWEARKAVDDAVGEIAQILRVDCDEIIITSGATESNNLAIQGMLPRELHEGKNHLLIGANEHSSIRECAYNLQLQKRVSAISVGVNNEGFIIEDQISQLSDAQDYYLASIEAVNGEIGTIQDIESIHNILQTRSIPFHTDAAQAPAAIDISGLAQHCELMSLSAHKVYGPKGIGLLYISREIQDRFHPIMYGGGQQRGLRPGTIPVPLVIGFKEALRIVQREGGEERRKIADLRNQVIQALRDSNPEIRLNGPENERRHPGNANILLSDIDAEDFLLRLQPHIAASTGSACTSGIPEPSRVLREIGLSKSEAASSIRLCFGRFNNVQQTVHIIDLIERFMNQY